MGEVCFKVRALKKKKKVMESQRAKKATTKDNAISNGTVQLSPEGSVPVEAAAEGTTVEVAAGVAACQPFFSRSVT